MLGKYTCKSTTADSTCATLYYLEELVGSNDINAYTYSINNTIPYMMIGNLPYNPGYSFDGNKVGYKYTNISGYNPAYQNHITSSSSTVMLTGETFPTTGYYYSQNIERNPETGKMDLIDPVEQSELDSIIGYYTCKEYGTSCLWPYYVTGQYNSNTNLFYYQTMYNQIPLTDNRYKFTYGSSFIKNEDGTYTIQDFSLASYAQYYNIRKSLYKKYICLENTTGTCSQLGYVKSESVTSIGYIYVTDTVYADSFIYEDGVYKLAGNMTTAWNYIDNATLNEIGSKHYVCDHDGGTECEKIKYVINISRGQEMTSMPGGDKSISFTMNVVELSGGISIQDVTNNWISNTNQEDSLAKKIVEEWYEDNLLSFDDLIDDTIFCNDRTISSLNGWDPNNTIKS